MSDIVESLRYWALPPAGETREPENAALLKLAADDIERLREENTLLTKGWQPATPTALLDEIERLRGLLGDVQIILDSHNNIVGNLNGEITRLRGLLREMRDGGAMADSPDMWRRIDEALDDDR